MPDVFKAISPHYAFRYFFSAGQASWVSLNGILLCVSGSEALFADMGHFSHMAITVSVLQSLSMANACEQPLCGSLPRQRRCKHDVLNKKVLGQCPGAIVAMDPPSWFSRHRGRYTYVGMFTMARNSKL